MEIPPIIGDSRPKGNPTARPSAGRQISRYIDAMEVIVQYHATIETYSFRKTADDDFVFSSTRRLEGEPHREEWQEKDLEPYEVRDQFVNVSDEPEAVIAFLEKNGNFLPGLLGTNFTLRHFQKWKRLVELVREHKQLATAMQEGRRKGDAVEALKAIGGAYSSSFFEATFLPDQIWTPQIDAAGLVPQMQEAARSFEASRRDEIKSLCQWFRNPPAAPRRDLSPHIAGMSIELVPAVQDDNMQHHLARGGTMAEYLLSKDQLRKVMLIRGQTSMQAIAATIYADWITGVSVKKCKNCNELFAVKEKNQRRDYCDNTCKGTAHMQRNRSRKRQQQRNNKAASSN